MGKKRSEERFPAVDVDKTKSKFSHPENIGGTPALDRSSKRASERNGNNEEQRGHDYQYSKVVDAKYNQPVVKRAFASHPGVSQGEK